jgi:hypothetical protein
VRHRPRADGCSESQRAGMPIKAALIEDGITQS